MKILGRACYEVTLGVDVLYDWNKEKAVEIGKIIRLRDVKRAVDLLKRKDIEVYLYILEEFYLKEDIEELLEITGADGVVYSKFKNILKTRSTI